MKLNPKPNLEFLSVDNFYFNPFEVRRIALAKSYYEDNRYFKGFRSVEPEIALGTKEAFENLLGKGITNWNYGTNGIFQYCPAETPLVYHMDGQQWAGVVYLTPGAPPECGTSFFRSHSTQIRRACDDEEVIKETFAGGFYDRSRFELVDSVGNVFNRLVLWDAKMIHSASQYFGKDKESARLFHVFFFDVE